MSSMSSMRTLTIGDRTISYEAGLESISLASLAPSSGQGPDWCPGPERKVSLAKSESADSGVGAEPGEEEAEAERRVIRPDDTAVRRLLNFDEEEEDEYIEEESDIDDDDADNRLKEANDQSVLNTKWRQAIVKDLARHSDKGAPGLGSCDSLDSVLGAAADTRQGKL